MRVTKIAIIAENYSGLCIFTTGCLDGLKKKKKMTHKKQFFLDYNQLILCNIILFKKKKMGKYT